jgi:DNA helicase II / ATP-dependent DNA helicase PcrA
LVAVGDPRQAIYGFRGADSNALKNIKKEFNAIELPLSISYRCPKSVVREAQNYVSHILPSETAPEGTVEALVSLKLTDFKPNDMVLCRFKVPMIQLAYRLLGARIPADEKRDMIDTIIRYSSARTTRELIGEVEALFGEDTKNVVRLSTIHKAKGLESKRVFWLDPYYSIKRKQKEWELEQEENLKYVAVTRSQDYLGFISIEDIQ